MRDRKTEREILCGEAARGGPGVTKNFAGGFWSRNVKELTVVKGCNGSW